MDILSGLNYFVEQASSLIAGSWNLLVSYGAGLLSACASCACEAGHCMGSGGSVAGSAGAGAGGVADPHGHPTGGVSGSELYEHIGVGVGLEAGVTAVAGEVGGSVLGTLLTVLLGGAPLYEGIHVIHESGGQLGGKTPGGRWMRQFAESDAIGDEVGLGRE